MGFLLSPHLDSAASILAGTLSEKQRHAALESIAREGTSDAARLLMDLFHLTPWGPHRRAIVRTLGRFTDGRTCEFLYRLAVGDPDLTIGREAVLALGRVGGPQSQEILLSLARRESYPFRREAVHALRAAKVLTVAEQLLEMFAPLKAKPGARDASESALFETILLVLAAHGISGIESDLVTLMQEACQNQDSHLTHACLLAAGALGSGSVREAVRCLDVDDRSVTAALKETILKLMDARPRQSIEDVITDLLKALADRHGQGEGTAEEAGSLSLSLYRLAEFTPDDLGLAAGLLQDQVDPGAALWLKSLPYLAAAQRSVSDQHEGAAPMATVAPVVALLREALAAGEDSLVSVLAKFARTHLIRLQHESRALRKRRGRWRHVLEQWEGEDWCALALVLPDPELLEFVCGAMAGRSKGSPPSDEAVINGINGLVAQVHMTTDDPSASRCLDVLTRLALDTARSVPVRGRAIRAMGQIAFVQRVSEARHDEVTEILVQLLRQSGMRGALFPSIIHALGHLPSRRSLEILGGSLQDQADALAAAAVLEPMLLALTNFPRHLLRGCTLRLSPDHLADAGIARLCLRLLGLGVALVGGSEEACRWLVKEALVSRDFSDVVLGLDAVHTLVHESDWHLVLALAAHEHEAIRSLALERLCRSRRSSFQNRLVEFLHPGSGVAADLLLHCFDVFEVDAQDPPLQFARFLVDAVNGKSAARPDAGPLARADVRLEGLGLAEQILLLEGGRATDTAQAAAPGGESETAPGSGAPATVLSDIDRIEASLRRDLPHFNRYSETLKTVLRNAELPFSHPEIFKESVDKSTAIIEFVKSIDLLLQERIGEPLFLGSRPEVLARLQSRVARLGLHDLSGDNARAMRLLGIDHIFTPELFPSIKLSRLVQSIMAGRFVTEQLRILDGLKGWAIFLVLFARSYVGGGAESEPLLQVSGQHDDRVTRLAWEMILLQERRNIAAHRGTILDGAEILALRQQSVFVLGSIDALCPPQQRGRCAKTSGPGPWAKTGS